jgi:hypothetical protein
MGTRAEADYVGRRALLLAQLVLTRRKGVWVFSYGNADNGTDLFAKLPSMPVKGLDQPIQPSLAVLVKGTSVELDSEEDANAYAKKTWKPLSANPLMLSPLAVMIFSMEGDQGFYSWLMEPKLYDEGAPGLDFVETPDMTKITRKSIDQMLDKVESWYTAMAGVLLRHPSYSA